MTDRVLRLKRCSVITDMKQCVENSICELSKIERIAGSRSDTILFEKVHMQQIKAVPLRTGYARLTD